MSRLAVIAALAVVVASGCGDDGPSRSDVVAVYADEVARPRFEDFVSSATRLVTAIDDACADPSTENVDLALDASVSSRAEWLATKAVWSGPAMDRRSDALIDWPVRGSDIDAFVGNAAAGDITADVVAKNVGADTRGLSALRYVLEGDDAVARLGDGAWCDYLRATAAVVAEEAGALSDAWSSLDLEDADSWLGMIVNDNINLVHKLTEEPRDEGDVEPDVAADRAAQLTGVADVFATLGPILGDDLSERLTAEIDDSRGTSAGGDIERGRELARAVEATLATEVAAHLGITIGFSDADGDSAG